jgi:DNA repair protein RecO (recombination protein O)
MNRKFRSYRVEAIVLKHADWGEADRLLTIYSREDGKVRVRAKGVRKIRSRRAGHLEPFTRVAIQLAQSRDMPIVTQAEAIDSYPALREDLERIGYASYVAELVDKFSYEEGQNLPLYNLLRNTFSRLNAAGLDYLLVLRYFEIRLLDYTGFRPDLTHCMDCGEEVQPEDQFFSVSQGGVLCPACGRTTVGAVPISMDALRYLRHFQRSPFDEATRAAPTEDIHREMEQVVQHYLTYTLERGLKSTKFIRTVRRTQKEE